MANSTALATPLSVQRASLFCADRKAADIIVLDISRISTATDYFVIASGTSDTHVRAVAEHVLQEMKKEGIAPHHVEGMERGRWVLLDYFDFVVHVFHPALRDFYQLERLWSDAEVIPLEREGARP